MVERYTASGDPDRADPASGLTIIQIPHPSFTNHYGGLVAFGPDGYLYLGTGDGGSSGDPNGNAQNLNSLLGKLLRLDVANASQAVPYLIPATNPYRNQAGSRPEIWASGLRNPWRYAFDGDRLYIADVGQDQREEIDLEAAAQGGLNYGWNRMEGSSCYLAQACDTSGLALPLLDYSHADAGSPCSITGGYVYRGAAIPALAGQYFYSDYCAGFLRSFVAVGRTATDQHAWTVPKVAQATSFGRDGQGELYVIGANAIWKIVQGSEPASARRSSDMRARKIGHRFQQHLGAERLQDDAADRPPLQRLHQLRRGAVGHDGDRHVGVADGQSLAHLLDQRHVVVALAVALDALHRDHGAIEAPLAQQAAGGVHARGFMHIAQPQRARRQRDGTAQQRFRFHQQHVHSALRHVHPPRRG